MKKNRIDSFTCFVGFLLILALFFSIKLFAGIQDGKKQYLALVSLGDLTYDDDFLKKAKKIEGIKEIWPVVETITRLRREILSHRNELGDRIHEVNRILNKIAELDMEVQSED